MTYEDLQIMNFLTSLEVSRESSKSFSVTMVSDFKWAFIQMIVNMKLL
jgi:hypothetical protein